MEPNTGTLKIAYTPPETMQEADADLAAIVKASTTAVKVAREIRPDAPNMQDGLKTLREIELHILHAQHFVKVLRGESHGEVPA